MKAVADTLGVARSNLVEQTKRGGNPRPRKGEAMTFEEVLDQAMAMLQRRGRLTYRTLKLHFQLDDEHLEAQPFQCTFSIRLSWL